MARTARGDEADIGKMALLLYRAEAFAESNGGRRHQPGKYAFSGGPNNGLAWLKVGTAQGVSKGTACLSRGAESRAGR